MATMVLLTIIVLVRMFRGRVRAVKAGEADAGYYKTYQEGSEPRELAQISRQVVNLFESPTLFYVACLAGLVTGIYPMTLILLAWAYVVARVIHAYIHIGSNRLPPRIASYFLSWFVLLAMWGTIVAGVATRQ
jgi:hypothetical protein